MTWVARPRSSGDAPLGTPERASMNRALTDVAIERDRQRGLLESGKIPFACEDPTIADAYKLAVITEEVGEVAKAMLEGTNLREELIQVAAVAVAWAEALDA